MDDKSSIHTFHTLGGAIVSQVDVYTSGPLRGLPIRGAIGALTAMAAADRRQWADNNPDLRETRDWLQAAPAAAPGVVIHLTNDDLDDWRDQVLFGGAHPGDPGLTEAAIDAAAADALVDWQPEPHGYTGTAVVLVIIASVLFWFGLRIITAGGAA